MALILGIETSCDETAAAVVQDGCKILSSVVASQVALHAQYGGVFPEIASREHVLKIIPVIEDALTQAHATLDDLDAIAVTYGPGLAGSLLVGVNAAKAMAFANDLPLIGVNHLEGHLYANWLALQQESGALEFPLIALIVSGGHSEIVLVRGHGDYELLGHTLDDAAGEAFDKVARLLGLGYPGGPAIQKAAEQGNPSAFKLPRAWLRGTYDFSFSGLKTAVLHLVQSFEGKKRVPVADIAASFQIAVADVLVDKTRQAAEEFHAKQILLAGGVSANAQLRKTMLARSQVPVSIPPIKLCVDNGAMIAAAAFRHFERGETSGWDLDVVPALKLQTSVVSRQ
ncbi:MAG: tRNA (adenosine(37)-N6)-threonylcarbamoyltransferase complex transferase subunit TsaD [Anaerolineales bacterium]|nr:tRNA (adenosine(37)-N6)-threonylcarbamoyltransferase complex transferase subunit TsaD [Anaerolineales bacterium]